MSSIVATAGVTAAPRGVAAKTLRTGLARVQLPDPDVGADGGEGQLRDQGDADPGGDQALDRLVVVALEGDPRLEPAAWQERTTWRAQGLEAEVWIQDSSREVRQPQLLAARQRGAPRGRAR